jgi:hypothetical protein
MILKPKYIPTYRYQSELSPAYLAQIQSGLIKERSMQHLDKFIRDCKEAGIWSKLVLCIPFVGETLSAAIIDIKGNFVPSSVNYIAGDYTEATGLTGDGSTKYINLGATPSGIFTANNCHLSAYVRTDNAQAGNRLLMGVSDATPHSYYIGSLVPASQVDARAGQTTTATGATALLKGFYHSQRIASTDLKLYRNGTQIATVSAATTGVPCTINMFAGAFNNNGAPAAYVNTPLSFVSVGTSMSAQEITDFYTIVQTLQTNLGRSV